MAVACRPQTAVFEQVKPPPPATLLDRGRAMVNRLLGRFTTFWNGLSVEQLTKGKLLIQVVGGILGLLVTILTLIGTILALWGVLRK
jgi:hypothetical protein